MLRFPSEQELETPALVAVEGEGPAEPDGGDPYPETPESIARARADQAAGRREFAEVNPGWVIAEDGRIIRQPEPDLRALNVANIAYAMQHGRLVWSDEGQWLLGVAVGQALVGTRG